MTKKLNTILLVSIFALLFNFNLLHAGKVARIKIFNKTGKYVKVKIWYKNRRGKDSFRRISIKNNQYKKMFVRKRKWVKIKYKLYTVRYVTYGSRRRRRRRTTYTPASGWKTRRWLILLRRRTLRLR